MEHDALFTWVHLSDIHIGHGDANHQQDQTLVLGALVADLKALIAKEKLKPDALFVTGDIAFSGAVREADEYTRAEAWLTKIAQAAGVPVEQVYVVPGNHDVQRPVDKPFAAKTQLQALRSTEDLDSALVDKEARAHLATRQANYLAFAKKWSPAGRPDGEVPRLYWQHRAAARAALRVRVCGLNTALLAADEATFGSDQGRLALGKRQIVETLTEPAAEENEAVLVLTHHPFTGGWLRDEAEVVGWIRRNAHLHLSGHTHEANAARTITGRRDDFVHVVAGAAHGEREADPRLVAHGYNVGALVRDGTSVALRVWPRVWSVKNKVFVRDGNVADDETGYATFPLPRVTLAGPPPAPSPPPPPPSEPSPVTTAREQIVEVLRRYPQLARAFGRSLTVEAIADALLGRPAREVLSMLADAAVGLTQDGIDPARNAERRALESLYAECVQLVTDWEDVVSRARALDPSSDEPIEAKVYTSTLAELLMARIDRRKPQFRTTGNVFDGLRMVPIGTATTRTAPVLLSDDDTWTAFRNYLLDHIVPELQPLRGLPPAQLDAQLNTALAAAGGAGGARPHLYYVVCAGEDHDLWRLSSTIAQKVPALRRVRLNHLDPDEGALIGHLKRFLTNL